MQISADVSHEKQPHPSRITHPEFLNLRWLHWQHDHGRGITPEKLLRGLGMPFAPIAEGQRIFGELQLRRALHPRELVTCKRCGGTDRADALLCWETWRPGDEVCGECVGKALDSCMAAVKAYMATPAGQRQLERELQDDEPTEAGA